MKIFSNDDIRAIDRATIEGDGVASRTLIERVAEAVAAEVMRLWRPSQPSAIFAGPGNNGADALAVGRILIENGWHPVIYLFNIGGNRLSQECRALRDELMTMPGVQMLEVTQSFTMPEIDRHWLVVDGLFGSGLHDPLPGGFQSLVRTINDSGAAVVSIDVPSGLFADWNANNPQRNIIHATLTMAIQFPRLSFMFADNAPILGHWNVVDINLSEKAIRNTRTNYYFVEEHDIRRILRPRPEFSTKHDYGSMLLVAGSYGMMGAAVMASRGAMRAGVGKLTVHAPRCGYNIVQTDVPDAMFNADKHDIFVTEVKAWQKYTTLAIGPGLGTGEQTVNALDTLLGAIDKPVVIDADGLNCIARRPSLLNKLPKMSVLTPHTGEFDRLFGAQPTGEARFLRALEVSRLYGVVIVLKGHFTAVVRPDGKVYFNSTGTPAMATAGSGDVLTGVIGALLAQGYKPEMAAVAGVYIHGLAGELAAETHGTYGTTASDIADCIGRAINSIMN